MSSSRLRRARSELDRPRGEQLRFARRLGNGAGQGRRRKGAQAGGAARRAFAIAVLAIDADQQADAERHREPGHERVKIARGPRLSP